MTVSQGVATATNLLDTLRGRLINFLHRYRLALYPMPGTVVTSGIVPDWRWLTTAELVRILTALPCMLMMYKCLRCGANQSDRKATSPDDPLVPCPTTTGDR